MRILPLALVSALALATAPAFAQSNDNSGIGGIIRNLNNALNGQNATPQDRNYNYSSPNGRYSGPGYNEPNYSGSSVPPGGYGDNGGMVFRSQADVRQEQRRLDQLQAQLNRAQQQLNQEYSEFDRARRNFEGR